MTLKPTTRAALLSRSRVTEASPTLARVRQAIADMGNTVATGIVTNGVGQAANAGVCVCVCVLCVWVGLTIQCTQFSPLCARCACVCVGTAPTKSGTSAGATRPTTASPDALVNGAVEKEVCSDDEFAPLGYEKGAAVATLMDESDCSDDGDEKANAGGCVCCVGRLCSALSLVTVWAG